MTAQSPSTSSPTSASTATQAATSPLPAMDPRLLAAMYGAAEEDEIDLLEYWRLIWRNKWRIIAFSLLVALLAAGYSLTKPNIFKAEVLLAPVSAGGAKGGGISAAFGGLASMAGIALPGGGNVETNLAVLKSREFLWSFIKEEKLMPILFEEDWDSGKKRWKERDPKKQPTFWNGVHALSGILTASVDKKTSLVTVAVEWTDPELAALWANQLVERLNSYLRQREIAQSRENLRYLEGALTKTRIDEQRKALYELIASQQQKAMLANTQKQFAFKVIDPAVAPDKKSKPKRSLIVVLATFVAGFLAVLVVFVREGMRKRKEEEVASAS